MVVITNPCCYNHVYVRTGTESLVEAWTDVALHKRRHFQKVIFQRKYLHLILKQKSPTWRRTLITDALLPFLGDNIDDVYLLSGILHVVCWRVCSIFSNVINTLRPRQSDRHFSDDVCKCIFLSENLWISIKIPPKFTPKGQTNNMPALVQIMAWRRSGDKPLSESMMISLRTLICVTRPQWVKIALCDDVHVEFSVECPYPMACTYNF